MQLVAIVLAGSCLLCGIEPSGECGWVLWEQREYSTPTEPVAVPEWEIHDATDSRAECLKWKEAVFNVKKRQLETSGPNLPVVKAVPYEKVFADYKGPGGLFTYTYLCLPASLDPRPKK